MKHSINILPSFALVCMALFTTSCYGPKKSQLKDVISYTKEIQQAEAEQIKISGQKKELAYQEERIDTTIGNRIKDKLDKYTKEMDSVNRELISLEEKLSDPKAFRKTYKDSIQTKIILLEVRNATSQLRLRRFTMLNEALDISRQNPFDLAAFFGSGKYNIPQENYQQAAELFLPAIDSLIIFSNKYADVPRTSTIVVNGFADGQSISTESDLQQILLQYLKKQEAEKKQLNWALSELRANEISTLLENLLQQKQKEFVNTDKITFSFYGYGQGETYPSKKISDYVEDDERRRIVLIYWSVIPD